MIFDDLSKCDFVQSFRQGRRYGGAWGKAPPGFRGCRQISKMSAFADECRVVGGVKEASIFIPDLPTVSQLR